MKTKILQAISALAAFAFKCVIDATTDAQTSRFLPDKAGAVVAALVWTWHMLAQAPESEMMWLAYFGSVAGWAEVRRRAAGAPGRVTDAP